MIPIIIHISRELRLRRDESAHDSCSNHLKIASILFASSSVEANEIAIAVKCDSFAVFMWLTNGALLWSPVVHWQLFCMSKSISRRYNGVASERILFRRSFNSRHRAVAHLINRHIDMHEMSVCDRDAHARPFASSRQHCVGRLRRPMKKSVHINWKRNGEEHAEQKFVIFSLKSNFQLLIRYLRCKYCVSNGPFPHTVRHWRHVVRPTRHEMCTSARVFKLMSENGRSSGERRPREMKIIILNQYKRHAIIKLLGVLRIDRKTERNENFGEPTSSRRQCRCFFWPIHTHALAHSRHCRRWWHSVMICIRTTNRASNTCVPAGSGRCVYQCSEPKRQVWRLRSTDMLIEFEMRRSKRYCDGLLIK